MRDIKRTANVAPGTEAIQNSVKHLFLGVVDRVVLWLK